MGEWNFPDLDLTNITFNLFPYQFWKGDLSFNGQISLDDCIRDEILPLILAKKEALIASNGFDAFIDDVLKNPDEFKEPLDKLVLFEYKDYPSTYQLRESPQTIIQNPSLLDEFPKRGLIQLLERYALLEFTDETNYQNIDWMSREEIKQLFVEKAQQKFFNSQTLRQYDSLNGRFGNIVN